MDDYAKYEMECEKLKAENKLLLEEFEIYLRVFGYGEKTIKNHLDNIDFYINDYLNYYDPTPASEGHSGVHDFLGNWFIRKAMWSSKATIKSSAASIKKFYTFMFEKELISKDDLEELKSDIKQLMPDWLQAMEDYESNVEIW